MAKQIQTTITAGAERQRFETGRKGGRKHVRASNANESRYRMDLPVDLINWMTTLCGSFGDEAPAERGTMMTVALQAQHRSAREVGL